MTFFIRLHLYTHLMLVFIQQMWATVSVITAWQLPHTTALSNYLLYVTVHTYWPMNMEQTECSETLAFKLQTPVNHPEESIQHSEHGESLKSRKIISWFPSPWSETLMYLSDYNAETPAPYDSFDRQWNIAWIPVNKYSYFY
jgi:hypothetical protein